MFGHELSRGERWLYISWFNFAVRYRRTLLGPVWLVIGPALFILLLGTLFSHVGDRPAGTFIPFLSIGLVVWTLVSEFVNSSTTIFQRHRSQILQGGMSLLDITIVGVLSTVLTFMHQIVIVAIVFLYYEVPLGVYALTSLIGLALIIANGMWLTMLFGIIGARYRDLAEIVQAIMRIAFLATPIIWMPSGDGHGGVLGFYLMLNPFYHFIEIVRAPLLDYQIAPSSWLVVIAITVIGFALTRLAYVRYSARVPLWL